MYDPIIQITENVISELVKRRDDEIYKQIIEMGVVVDKDELIKALAYDRDQYNKGYADGVRECIERLKQKFDLCGVIAYGILDQTAKDMEVEI